MTIEDDIAELRAKLSSALARIAEMEDWTANHGGLGYGSSGLNYPHPVVSVSTGEFGGGVMRLDREGMQLSTSGNPTAAIAFNNIFADDFATGTPQGWLTGWASANASQIGQYASDSGQVTTGDYATTEASFLDNDNSMAVLIAKSDAGTASVVAYSDYFGTRKVTLRGPLVYENQTSDPSADTGMFWYRSDNSRFKCRHGGEIAEVTTVFDRDVTPQAITNNSGEVTVYSYDPAGGLLSTDRMLRLTIIGKHLNNSGAGHTLTVRVKFGGTTYFDDVTGSIAASATERPFRLVVEMANLNSASAQWFTGLFMLGNTGTTTAGLGSLDAASDIVALFGGAPAKDTASAQFLTVTLQSSVASANITTTVQACILELI